MASVVVSPVLANAAAVSFTVIYVAGFYLFAQPRTLDRNHPVVMTARIKAVSVASLITVALVRLLIPESTHLATALGLVIPLRWTSLHLLRPVLLTITLFLGPLSRKYLENPEGYLQRAMPLLHELRALRDYVVAPFTEELVFRAAVIAVLYHAQYTRTTLIFISPLYFGIAHLHHMWEHYNTYGADRRALVQAAVQSAFQMTYTTVFGWYASFVFLRMNSVWSVVLCHAFCNRMGFPDLSTMPYFSSTQRTVVYASYLVGIIAFIVLFYPLTDPASAGGSFYWQS